MKKLILSVCLLLTCTSLCIASPLDHLLSRMTTLEKKTDKTFLDPDEEGYTDFSGVWVGACDDDPEVTETFDIKMQDQSSFIMDGVQYDIDALITQGVKNNLNFNESASHLRWSEDGSQLLVTSVYYGMGGYMTKANMETIIGNMTMSIENHQLVTRISGYLYLDGIPREEMNAKITCTFNRKSN